MEKIKFLKIFPLSFKRPLHFEKHSLGGGCPLFAGGNEVDTLLIVNEKRH